MALQYRSQFPHERVSLGQQVSPGVTAISRIRLGVRRFFVAQCANQGAALFRGRIQIDIWDVELYLKRWG